jgi:hypothetical protein
MPKQLSHRWWVPERQTLSPAPEKRDGEGLDEDRSAADNEQGNATFDPYFGRLDLLKAGKNRRYMRQRDGAKPRPKGTRRDMDRAG